MEQQPLPRRHKNTILHPRDACGLAGERPIEGGRCAVFPWQTPKGQDSRDMTETECGGRSRVKRVRLPIWRSSISFDFTFSGLVNVFSVSESGWLSSQPR